MTTTKSHRLCRLLTLSLLTALLLSGCSQEDKGLGSIASIGHGGSLDGQYNMSSIYVTDVYGGRASFGYGAVGGYPGASADIGGIGVPKRITGYWAKERTDGPGFESYYRITADIDSELAEQKVRTLQNYYDNFQSSRGIMRVEVKKQQIMVLFGTGCSPSINDCTPKEGADPDGLIEKDPNNVRYTAVLFDGLGESSPTPFPGSPYDERTIQVRPYHWGPKIFLTDTEGRVSSGSHDIGDLVRVQGDWIVYEKTVDPSVFIEHYFHLNASIDTESAKKKIQTLRNDFQKPTNLRSNTYVKINDDGYVKIYYALSCSGSNACVTTKRDDTQNLYTVLDEVNSLGILLFEAQAEESDTPFDLVDSAMDGKK